MRMSAQRGPCCVWGPVFLNPPPLHNNRVNNCCSWYRGARLHLTKLSLEPSALVPCQLLYYILVTAGGVESSGRHTPVSDFLSTLSCCSAAGSVALLS